jgi:hypothetical protein
MKSGDGSLMEPYPHHAENPAKLEAHMDEVFVTGARLLRPAIDAPYTDATAVLENTKHFQSRLSEESAVLPYCANAIKFYSSLGASDPDAFHTMIVKKTHQNLINAFNRFTAEKTIRSGVKWQHYVKKHLSELHDSAAFNRQITAAAPVYKKVAATGTGRPSLLPPVRPPTTHSKDENPYAGMPELRCYKPGPDDDSWEGEEMPPLRTLNLVDDDSPPELGKPIGNYHDTKIMKKLHAAEARGDMVEIRHYRRKAGLGAEFDDMPPFKQNDSTIEGNIGVFREAYYGWRKRHAQRKGGEKGKADEQKYREREESLERKKTKSNRAEEERRRENREADAMRKEREAEGTNSKFPGVYESSSRTQKLAAKQKPVEDQIDPSNPAESLKAVKWLRECCNAEGSRRVNLQAGSKYVFFAPSDEMIVQLLTKFAGNPIPLSKERVVSAHLAERVSTTTFKTLAGIHVEKNGATIVLPKVVNPQILGAEARRVASIVVKGCQVIVLPHDNLFHVPRK